MGKQQLNLEEYKTQYHSKQSTTYTKNIKRLNNIIRANEQIGKEGQYEYNLVYDAMPGKYVGGKKYYIENSNDDDADNIDYYKKLK